MGWLDQTFHLKTSQGTISKTLKRSSEYLSVELDQVGASKRYKLAKYSKMEKVIFEWFIQYQDQVNMIGDLILEKANATLKLLNPQHPTKHHLSQGWLDNFKQQHGIKSLSFRRKQLGRYT